MWRVGDDDQKIQMAEGDYGVGLPFTILETEITEHDSFKFVFKKQKNGEDILEKTYTGPDFINNGFELKFTQEDSEKFEPGFYVYRLDWYQDGTFMYNLINAAEFRVVDKA